jgi:hypothetical protein
MYFSKSHGSNLYRLLGSAVWLGYDERNPAADLDYLIMEVREDSHGIVCRESFDEMLSFKVQLF